MTCPALLPGCCRHWSAFTAVATTEFKRHWSLETLNLSDVPLASMPSTICYLRLKHPASLDPILLTLDLSQFFIAYPSPPHLLLFFHHYFLTCHKKFLTSSAWSPIGHEFCKDCPALSTTVLSHATLIGLHIFYISPLRHRQPHPRQLAPFRLPPALTAP